MVLHPGVAEKSAPVELQLALAGPQTWLTNPGKAGRDEELEVCAAQLTMQP